MIIPIDTTSIADYKRFLSIKGLPKYRIRGGFAEFPDEYAARIGVHEADAETEIAYTPIDGLYDYQCGIAGMAICKRKFAAFVDCGLGKTLMMLEFVRHTAMVLPQDKQLLIVSPLMVVDQTLEEAARFYGDSLPIERIEAKWLPGWLGGAGGRMGITNYDAMEHGLSNEHLGCMILDESSMLKSHYGKWGTACIALGKGVPYKLALTGTPAPNDQIEYANHAVFLDQFPSVNSFLARFFVNKGQTSERWMIKPHARKDFYRSLSHWAIFMSNPATYGWKDNCGSVPPVIVHIHNVSLTPQQRAIVGDETGNLFAGQIGGIMKRGKLGQLAKGRHNGKDIETLKPGFIRDLVATWPDRSTIIWCLYNAEQDQMDRMFPDAASIRGETKPDKRRELIRQFKSGEKKILIAKPKTLGFGLNLQIATRQVFSGLQDSYEQYYQAVKRSNRIGSTEPLEVHIPVTDIEWPMVQTVLTKARRVQEDTKEQEAVFHDSRI